MSDDSFEADEPLADVMAAFDSAEQHLTGITRERYQARLLKRVAWMIHQAWGSRLQPAWTAEDWRRIAGRWMSDYERMDEVVDEPAADPDAPTEVPVHGMFGPGIFGTGIDLSALDADTAWRLGLWVGQLIRDKENEIQNLKQQLKEKLQLPKRYRGSGLTPVLAPGTEIRLLPDVENKYIVSALDLERKTVYYDQPGMPHPVPNITKDMCGAEHDHGRCGLPPGGHNRHRAKTPYGEVEWNDPVHD